MHRGRPSLCWALALLAASSSAWGLPVPRPFEASGELGAVIFTPSAYRDALAAFGQEGPRVGVQLAARGLWGVAAHLRLGFRAGYTFSAAGPSAPAGDLGTAIASSDSVSFHLVDAGAVLRWSTASSTGPRFALDLEAGPALNVIAWRGTTSVVGVPRLGVAMLLGAQPTGLIVSGRLGFQWVPSGGAGGLNFADPAFAGFTLGLELGGGR